MDRERARRMQRIFTRALELPPAERPAMVAQACEGDQALEADVLKLLGAAEQSHEFLESPALASPREQARPVPDAVGNYLVIGVLGVGGMATVYEAIQENPHRRVALKVMHQSLTHTDAYLRFRFETETLARLHHPGIAQIYEAGAAQLGQPAPAPFFAMELVTDAVTITAYADRERLPLRERVAMLASVCDAVHHGHQHGVIHRDLKPGNVLVDGEGRAKVIDFGVARSTDSGAGSLTRTSDSRQLIGTLNYMSPEQCGAGADIDSRTDVYSLGVLLYELACGRLPHDLRDLPLPRALQVIVAEPARPPEFRPARTDRDLEAIINRAINKDPAHRYDSASALAADLRRWLNGLPTEARPPGVLEQARLFARRNRGLVAAGLLVVVSVALVAAISSVFVVMLTSEVQRRRQAEQQSTAERDVARWQAYTAQIAGALSAMKTGEFQQMRTRLAAANQPRRGWEWGFLSRLAERSLSTTLAHDNMIMDMAVSRDFQHIATAGASGDLRLWDGTGTQALGEFRNESGARMFAVAFTRDGRRLVSGDGDGTVRLHEVAAPDTATVLGQMPSSVRSVVELPDGRIAATSLPGVMKIWTPAGGAEETLSTDQPGGVRGVSLSPDDSLLATFNDEGHIWLRDSRSFAVRHRFKFPDAVRQVCISTDGTVLGAAGASASLLVWRIPDETLLHEIRATDGVGTVRSVAISHDARHIAAGLIHRGIVICSVSDGRVVGTLGGHTEAISGLRFRPGDDVLISSSWDRTLRTWRTADAAAPGGCTILAGHENNVRAVAFSPDGSMLASAAEDGAIRVWDPDLAIQIAELRPATNESVALLGLSFSPDGALLAAGGADNTARVWSTLTGQEVATLPGHAAWVYSVAFDPTGTRLATGNNRGELRVWDLATMREQLLIPAHTARVNSLCFSPDGSRIATGSRDKHVAMWDARTGEEVFRGVEHELDVFAVLFSRDGQQLYSGARDQSVRIWNARTGACEKVLSGHGQYVTSLSLTADGSRLAAGSWYGEIVLYDVATSDMIASFRAHDAAIRGVAFSPDGRWLASGGYDTTVRLFESATREDADAARARAAAGLADAAARLRPHLAESHPAPEALLASMREKGLDPEGDPWLRKRILSELNPPRPR